MRKGLLKVLSLLFVLSFLLMSVESIVQATCIEPSKDPAHGDWVFEDELEGHKVHMDDLTTPPPADWMRLMTHGVYLETFGATSLCHPFPGVPNGWEGGIYMLNGNSWLPLPSTTAWVPDEEGKPMVCTSAPMTGTYALFGFCGENCKSTPKQERNHLVIVDFGILDSANHLPQ